MKVRVLVPWAQYSKGFILTDVAPNYARALIAHNRVEEVIDEVEEVGTEAEPETAMLQPSENMARRVDPPKRRRGRPAGSKDSRPRTRRRKAKD